MELFLDYRNRRVGAFRRRQEPTTEVAVVSRCTSNKRPTYSYEKGGKFRMKQRFSSKLKEAQQGGGLFVGWILFTIQFYGTIFFLSQFFCKVHKFAFMEQTTSIIRISSGSCLLLYFLLFSSQLYFLLFSLLILPVASLIYLI